jgi:hypothetical protein
MTELTSKKIEGDQEYVDKLRIHEILNVIERILTVGKSKTEKDLNNALISECHIAKPIHLNQTKEILSYVQNIGLITVDENGIFYLTKSFNFYHKKLHISIIEYQNKINKERLGFSYHVTEGVRSFESERKTPLTEEQKKELEKTLGDKF